MELTKEEIGYITELICYDIKKGKHLKREKKFRIDLVDKLEDNQV